VLGDGSAATSVSPGLPFDNTSNQGLILVQFSAQPEPFLPRRLYEITQCVRKECSRRDEKWTSVSPCQQPKHVPKH